MRRFVTQFFASFLVRILAGILYTFFCTFGFSSDRLLNQLVKNLPLWVTTERVRIFSGFTKSKGGKMITPSVVTLIVSKGTIDCRFIAFVGIPLAFKDKVKIPPEGEKIRFQGEDCPKGGDG